MIIERTLLKFYSNKSYRYFPGCAIIKFLTNPEQIKIIIDLKREMEESGKFEKFIFLPENSYHMTVSDLVTYCNMHENDFFANFIFKEETNFDKIDQKIMDVLKQEFFQLNVKMVPEKIIAKQIRLQPKTKEDQEKLIQFRRKIHELLGLKMNEGYKFHISLTYQLFEITEEEKQDIDRFLQVLSQKYLGLLKEFEIDIATLVAFNDMAEYKLLSGGRVNLGVTQDKGQ